MWNFVIIDGSIVSTGMSYEGCISIGLILALVFVMLAKLIIMGEKNEPKIITQILLAFAVVILGHIWLPVIAGIAIIILAKLADYISNFIEVKYNLA